MYSYTFEKVIKKKEDNGLFDIFRQTVIDMKLAKFTTIVQTGEEMRLDKVSNRLYGSTNFVEELMVINNICNPWSIKEGDPIMYVHPNEIPVLKQLEKEDVVSNKSINPKKSTRVDENRSKGVAPTIKPKNLKQVIVDKNNQTIKVNGKLQ